MLRTSRVLAVLAVGGMAVAIAASIRAIQDASRRAGRGARFSRGAEIQDDPYLAQLACGSFAARAGAVARLAPRRGLGDPVAPA